jgi:hypothetical protein
MGGVRYSTVHGISERKAAMEIAAFLIQKRKFVLITIRCYTQFKRALTLFSYILKYIIIFLLTRNHWAIIF